MTARNFYRVDAAGRIEKLSGSILKEITGAATVAAAMDAIRNDMADARRARLRFPLLYFRVARRPTAEKLPDIYRW